MSKKSQKKRPSSGRRGSSRRPNVPYGKLLLSGVALTALLGTIGYFIWDEAKYITADAQGCFPGNPLAAHTVALVDSSEPRFDEAQTRDLLQGFRKLFASGLRFQERFSLITTEEGTIGSVPQPVLTFCQSASDPEELNAIGAAPATSAYLNRQAESLNEKTHDPVVRAVFDSKADAQRRQARESPILEQIQSVSRLSEFGDDLPHRRLIVVSDLLQSTQEAQFCVTQGHLPSFEKFKATPYYERVKPKSLNGVDVSIYMLIRNGYGEQPFPYCSEDELRTFWTAYFKDAGAASVDIIRLRTGRRRGGE